MEERVLMNYVFNGESVAKFEKEVNDEWLANGWRVKSVSIGGEEGSSMIVFVLQRDLDFKNDNSPKEESYEEVSPKFEYPKSFISEFDLFGIRNTKCEITDIKIVQKKSQIIMNFKAKKLYDNKGESSNEEIRFNYKVKDFSGVVVSKGSWGEHNIFVGDVVKGCVSIKDMPVSGYIFEFSDFKQT